MTRSEIMSRIRSKWTGPEKAVHNFFKSKHVKHKMHPKLAGSPDALIGGRVALFIDGCFWHACPRHYRAPKTNVEFWTRKIRRNVERDRAADRGLSAAGYEVVRVWECELKADGLWRLLERLKT